MVGGGGTICGEGLAPIIAAPSLLLAIEVVALSRAAVVSFAESSQTTCLPRQYALAMLAANSRLFACNDRVMSAIG